jgi:hypothetical protein
MLFRVRKPEPALSDLRVYLTDGFAGDHAIVRVNGQTVLDKAGVTTKKLYGLAEQLSPVDVTGGEAEVEVSLPEKNVAASFKVDLSQGSHVPVALEGEKLVHSVRKMIGFM